MKFSNILLASCISIALTACSQESATQDTSKPEANHQETMAQKTAPNDHAVTKGAKTADTAKEMIKLPATSDVTGVLHTSGDKSINIGDGLRLAHLTFDSVDRTNKGYVDLGDMQNQRKLIFVSMDADDSHNIDLNEFMTWDYGFANVASSQNRELAYSTALKVVFSFWDRDGNGSISEPEQIRAISADFKRADINNDSMLDRSEFINGFSIMTALKAALNPATSE